MCVTPPKVLLKLYRCLDYAFKIHMWFGYNFITFSKAPDIYFSKGVFTPEILPR